MGEVKTWFVFRQLNGTTFGPIDAPTASEALEVLVPSMAPPPQYHEVFQVHESAGGQSIEWKRGAPSGSTK